MTYVPPARINFVFAIVTASLLVGGTRHFSTARAADADAAVIAEALKAVKPEILERAKGDAADMVRGDQSRRLREANRLSNQEWQAIKTRDDWERFRATRLRALRASLGIPPAASKQPPEMRFTGKIVGDKFVIHKLLFQSRQGIIFQSRPDLWVTANLYAPVDVTERKPTDVTERKPATPSMPGILICHSHHTPKTQGELQDMGMTWARTGCLVLVMDQLGHGERRQHPFHSEKDYPKPFRVGRQDYHFRYDSSLQLQLVGESLVGAMAWDMMRGVDVLLDRGCDPKRIILLGAVAGGGDPAAVTAAIDERIAAAVPFNFGGPQPETRYPLPDDVETSFNYAGGGSWESTRNLRFSAGAGGFLPWTIVGGIAPRRLVFAHEFSWDRERDPVWKRLQAIYGFYGASDHLAFAHGRGELRGQPPAATHCTHIGREHRKQIHEAFRRWFGIDVTDKDEFSARRESRELMCLTPEIERELKLPKLHELLAESARKSAVRASLAVVNRSRAELREDLRERWSEALGPIKPGTPEIELDGTGEKLPGGCKVHRLVLKPESGIFVPLLLCLPVETAKRPLPVVIGVAQAGKEGFLRDRREEVAALLAAGVAVCLPDLRGTGETRSGSERSRTSGDTSRSSTELMLGGTMLGARLRDLRSVLAYLRGRDDLDAKRLALWGDSLAEVNPPDANFRVPHDAEARPKQSEPAGALLALLAGLFEDDVHCVYARGGLAEFRSVLDSPFVYVPHDAVVPRMLTFGDVPDLAAALAPRAVRLEGLVDGHNRALSAEAVAHAFATTAKQYRNSPVGQKFSTGDKPLSAGKWLAENVAR